MLPAVLAFSTVFGVIIFFRSGSERVKAVLKILLDMALISSCFICRIVVIYCNQLWRNLNLNSNLTTSAIIQKYVGLTKNDYWILRSAINFSWTNHENSENSVTIIAMQKCLRHSSSRWKLKRSLTSNKNFQWLTLVRSLQLNPFYIELHVVKVV